MLSAPGELRKETIRSFSEKNLCNCNREKKCTSPTGISSGIHRISLPFFDYHMRNCIRGVCPGSPTWCIFRESGTAGIPSGRRLLTVRSRIRGGSILAKVREKEKRWGGDVFVEPEIKVAPGWLTFLPSEKARAEVNRALGHVRFFLRLFRKKKKQNKLLFVCENFQRYLG